MNSLTEQVLTSFVDVMSQGSNEEFVVFPSQSEEGNVMLGIGYSGSHAPGYLGVSGRQHRPTGHDHESLRCSEVDSDLEGSGPGRERTLDMERTLAGKAVPPGIDVGKPGKLADSMRRVDQGFAPPVVAMLRAASALRKGEVSGHVGEARGAANDPPPPAIPYNTHLNNGLRHIPRSFACGRLQCF